MSKVGRFIYEVIDLKGNIITEGPSDKVAKFLGMCEATVRNKSYTDGICMEKYRVRLSSKMAKEKPFGERPLSEYELLELVLVKRREELCSLDVDPSDALKKLKKEHGVICEVSTVTRDVGVRQTRRKKRTSYTVKVVKRGVFN